ncbi:DUF2730 family protein [Thalassotalea euphylliae]|uniref:DUF2730 family protein n=1 Tax=Thalassotalea euphylliae TaxID=1655234 RepID=A0A3E0U8X8_9GAMM|nr:DUF2730 family protein [Thalassotalea euphylliae]REL32525.1 DUF2730 family protein [Thalassotalea euphylliae]
MEWLNEHFKIIQFVLSAAFAAIVFVMMLVFVKRKEHSDLKARVSTLEQTYCEKDEHTKLANRVTTIETQLKDLPSSKDFHQLEKDIGELKGSLEGVQTLLANINNQVNMLVENEIKG